MEKTRLPFQFGLSEQPTRDINEVVLRLNEREFNLFREVLRELLRTAEPWELSSLTGWNEKELNGILDALNEYGKINSIEL